MDPVTIIGICGKAAKLIAKISSGVNGVLDAPKSVQALSNELSAVYLALGQLRILVENPSIREHHKFELWANGFQSVLGDCEDTFGKIGQVVEKARSKKKETGKLGVVKRIEWAWKDSDVLPLKDMLERYKSTLILMLEALNCHQQDAIDEKVRAVLAAVEELHQDHANIKKEYVVLAKGHSAYASTDLRLFDTRQQNKEAENPRFKELESALRDMELQNQKLKDDFESSNSQVEELRAALQKSGAETQRLREEVESLTPASLQVVELEAALQNSKSDNRGLEQELEDTVQTLVSTEKCLENATKDNDTLNELSSGLQSEIIKLGDKIAWNSRETDLLVQGTTEMIAEVERCANKYKEEMAARLNEALDMTKGVMRENEMLKSRVALYAS